MARIEKRAARHAARTTTDGAGKAHLRADEGSDRPGGDVRRPSALAGVAKGFGTDGGGDESRVGRGREQEVRPRGAHDARGYVPRQARSLGRPSGMDGSHAERTHPHYERIQGETA